MCVLSTLWHPFHQHNHLSNKMVIVISAVHLYNWMSWRIIKKHTYYSQRDSGALSVPLALQIRATWRTTMNMNGTCTCRIVIIQ